jgi:hypothetical protein
VLVMKTRRWTAARALSGTSSPKSTTMGIATPYVAPLTSCRSVLSLRPPGFAMVANVTRRVEVLRSPVAVSVAEYDVPYASGAAGTQALPSSRSRPSTRWPLASASSTAVSLPPVTDALTSAATGTAVAPAAGDTSTMAGGGGGGGSLPATAALRVVVVQAPKPRINTNANTNRLMALIVATCRPAAWRKKGGAKGETRCRVRVGVRNFHK